MSEDKIVTIRPIDNLTVNKICSGQVVLSLATAVKELVENSIDAGATSIQIKLEEYGSELIEVTDNGSGVEEVNFQGLTLKHHTSKISEFSDLYSVETFGFRGEALSSLCALSDVTIITQHKNADIGTILKFNHNGNIISSMKTLRKVGTTVKLENLFNTLPIRRTEFLKNLKKEFFKMCNVLYAYGLQSVGVRIICTNQVSKAKLSSREMQEEHVKRLSSTTVMNTKGESVESNIISIFGVKQKQSLLPISEIIPSEETLSEFGLSKRHLECKKFELNGFISSCSHGSGRTCSDRQFFYINSRPVDNSKISKLVNDVYHQYNNRQDPFVILNIKVANGAFDMNVTPDKRQILLENEKLLLAVLKDSLHEVFRKISVVFELQNVGPSYNTTSEVPKKLEEKLEQSKPNFSSLFGRNRNLKKEADSRISNFLNSWHQQENSQKKDSQNQSNFCKNTYSIPKDVIIIPPIHPEESKSKLVTKNLKVMELLAPCTPDQKQKPDKITMNLDHVEQENKRKLVGENLPAEEHNESEKNTSKRLKIDDGLREEEKKRRKCIVLNITLSDIKKLNFQCCDNISEKHKEIKFLTEIKPQNNDRAEEELKREIQKDNFKEMEIIGQFNLGFIITKLNSDLFIIDQHASDEKYNFETLQLTTIMQTQKLFNPEKLELTVDKEELMVQHRDVFRRNGFNFVFDENGPHTRRISLTVIPYSKNCIFGKDDVDELLFLLENATETKKLRPTRVRSMFASRACRKSVMVGTPLSLQEMKRIVDHMGDIEHPWNCPHGRPTMRHLVNLQMINL